MDVAVRGASLNLRSGGSRWPTLAIEHPGNVRSARLDHTAHPQFTRVWWPGIQPAASSFERASILTSLLLQPAILTCVPVRAHLASPHTIPISASSFRVSRGDRDRAVTARVIGDDRGWRTISPRPTGSAQSRHSRAVDALDGRRSVRKGRRSPSIEFPTKAGPRGTCRRSVYLRRPSTDTGERSFPCRSSGVAGDTGLIRGEQRRSGTHCRYGCDVTCHCNRNSPLAADGIDDNVHATTRNVLPVSALSWNPTAPR